MKYKEIEMYYETRRFVASALRHVIRRTPTRILLGTVTVLGCASASLGCTTSMTNLAPAHTLEPGEFEVAGGGQVNVNTRFVSASANTIDQTIEAGVSNDGEFRKLVETMLGAGLFFPSPTPEVMLRAGLSEKPLHGFDAGLRYNGSTLKGDAKLQWKKWGGGRGAASVQLGVGHQFNAGPSGLKKLGDWSRTDLDLMVPLGWRYKDFARAWVAPRVIWSHVSAQPKADLESSRFQNELDAVFENQQLWYAGVNAGGMLGYKYLYLAFELNVMYVVFRPEVLGKRRNLNGLTFVPAGGLVVRF